MSEQTCPIDTEDESADGANQDDVTILGEHRDEDGEPMLK